MRTDQQQKHLAATRASVELNSRPLYPPDAQRLHRLEIAKCALAGILAAETEESREMATYEDAQGKETYSIRGMAKHPDGSPDPDNWIPNTLLHGRAEPRPISRGTCRCAIGRT